MATAHLLFGYLGSGKTTLARKLEQELPAVRFTPDDFMARLFGPDPPAASFRERAAAISDLLEPLWTACLRCGADVVLDFGFWSRAERDRARALAALSGAGSRLHVLTCPEEEARRRLRWRNAAPGRALYIADATYDALLVRFEPLEPDEEVAETHDADLGG